MIKAGSHVKAGRGWKRIQMCRLHVPAPHDECNCGEDWKHALIKIKTKYRIKTNFRYRQLSSLLCFCSFYCRRVLQVTGCTSVASDLLLFFRDSRALPIVYYICRWTSNSYRLNIPYRSAWSLVCFRFQALLSWGYLLACMRC